MTEAGDEPVGRAAQAADRQPHLPAQLVEILTASIAQFDAFEQIPDTRIGVQLRRVARQAFQLKAGRGPGREEVLDRLAVVDGRAVPDHEQLPANLAQQLTEEGDDRRTAEGRALDVGEQPPIRGERADRREMIPRERDAQNGSVAARGIRARHEGEQIEGRFIYEKDRAVLLAGFA